MRWAKFTVRVPETRDFVAILHTDEQEASNLAELLRHYRRSIPEHSPLRSRQRLWPVHRNDAQAIVEAASRPAKRFVAIRTSE